MDGEEERNAPGAWMRGEERKNGSTKGREENGGLVAAQTRSIRPLPPTSPSPPLPRRARGRTERGTWFLRECTDTQWNLPGFFFRTYVPFFLSLSFPPSRLLTVFIRYFFTPRSRRSAILRGNVLPSPFKGSISSQ